MIDNPAWNLVREAVKDDEAVANAFRNIEADVEQLINEVNGYRQVERDLRSALEADSLGGAEFQRR